MKPSITVTDETRQWVEEYRKKKEEMRLKRLAKKVEKNGTPVPKQWPYWKDDTK